MLTPFAMPERSAGLHAILRNLGRQGSECWVVQASPDWSREHLEQDADEVISMLLNELGEIIGCELTEVIHVAAHRWRFAKSGSAGEGALWDADTRVGACGDWLIGPRIEDAYLSGIELAEKVLADG